MTHLIDASALLAILFEEPGADMAARHCHRGAISAVSVCESVERVGRIALPSTMISAAIERFEIDVLSFGTDEALIAGEMRRRSGFAGISLADRACLATAERRGLPILTADRAWSSLGLDIEIVQIR